VFVKKFAGMRDVKKRSGMNWGRRGTSGSRHKNSRGGIYPETGHVVATVRGECCNYGGWGPSAGFRGEGIVDSDQTSKNFF